MDACAEVREWETVWAAAAEGWGSGAVLAMGAGLARQGQG